MKQFIDEGTNIDISSPIKAVQTIVTLIILAPYRMIDTVSTRIIYLKKSQIMKMLLYSVVIACIITAINAGIMLYLDIFSLTAGKFPIASMLIGIAILIAAYFALGVIDFVAYSQLDALVLMNTDTNTELSEAEEATELSEDSQSEDKHSETIKKDLSAEFSDSMKEEEANSVKNSIDNTFSLGKWSISNSDINIGKTLSNDELLILQEEITNSIETSEYLAASTLAHYDTDEVMEDTINLDVLNIGVIPTKFRALA